MIRTKVASGRQLGELILVALVISLLLAAGKGASAQSALFASDGANGDYFGNAISATDTTLAVGSPFHTVNGNAWQGAVYVYTRSNGSWMQAAELTAPDGGEQSRFGTCVALRGNTLVVGAVGRANFAPGAVYLYKSNGATWTLQTQLTASDATLQDFFGWSVDLHGTTLVVGAPGRTVNGASQQGTAYVFQWTRKGWGQGMELTAADGAAYDHYGYSVGISDTTVAVGAWGVTDPAGVPTGAVYVYDKLGSAWPLQAELMPPDGENLGFCLEINGRTLVSGALGSSAGGYSRAGAVYVFHFDGTNWTQQARLTASDVAANARFGYSVALKNQRLLVGAFGQNPFGGSAPSMAYLFTMSRTVWAQRQQWTAPASDPSDEFGWSVALGVTGIFIGAPQQEGAGQQFPGAVYTYP